ncbi:MAG: transposase [Candidatus Micrarchaeia archaeon]
MLNFRYRIYPSKRQAALANNQMHLAKEIYNLFLDEARRRYAHTGESFSQYDMNNTLRELKTKRPEFAGIHSQVLQNISKRVSDAYKAFFQRVREKNKGKKVKAGFPRMKKSVSSMTYPQTGFTFTNNHALTLSGIGSIPIVLHRPLKGKVKTCTIKRSKSGKWHVNFSVETPNRVFKSNEMPQVGVDLGLNRLVTLSNGERIDSPRFLRKSEERIKRCQRRMSSKEKRSKNHQRARAALSRAYEMVGNQRSDFLHKLSRKIVSSYSLVGVEKLKIGNMMKNRCLAKSISDASWDAFIQMLCYKAGSAGCRVVNVAPEYTSQTCSNCGNARYINLKERQYCCHNCGLSEDRDVNAAKNILARATAGRAESHACGETPTTLLEREAQGVSLKQELHGTSDSNHGNSSLVSGSPRP